MRLFFRIYRAFILAILAALTASVFVSAGIRRDSLSARWATIGGGPLAAAAQMAADRYVAGGSGAAQRYLSEFSRTARLDVALYDEQNKLLYSNVESSSRLDAFATPALTSGTGSQPTLLPTQLSGVFPVRDDRTDRRFVLVGAAKGGLLPNLLLPVARAVVALLVVGIVCAVLTRSVTRPILALQNGARRLASGDLEHRVTAAPPLAGRRDSLGDLGRDFDTMAERLQAARAAQNRLLADVSHELRSPLTRLGFAVALARPHLRDTSTPENDAGNAALDRVQHEADRMNELIGQLLTLARWENAEAALILPQQVVDLNALVRGVVDDANYEGESAGKSCRLILSDPLPPLSADAEILRSAIENIVRNAIRHTEPCSTVAVAVQTPAPKTVTITVHDHGPGVPDTALADIFRPFYRLDTARDRTAGGAGLGLAIADRAIRAHGGEIRAENAAEGGLCVTISLPLSD